MPDDEPRINRAEVVEWLRDTGKTFTEGQRDRLAGKLGELLHGSCTPLIHDVIRTQGDEETNEDVVDLFPED